MLKIALNLKRDNEGVNETKNVEGCFYPSSAYIEGGRPKKEGREQKGVFFEE